MNDTPKAISEGIMHFMGCALRVYVLDNGQKVVSAEDLEQVLELLELQDEED